MRTLAKPCGALLVAAALLLPFTPPRASAQKTADPFGPAGAASLPAAHLQKLLAGDATAGDRFGKSVALSADGGTALVGSYLDTNSGGLGAGSAYVFVRSGGVWTQQQRLQASDAASRDWFGWSVALSADGNTALVGATEGSSSNASPGGKAYVFTRSGGVWTEQQRLQASDKTALDDFGTSVALSADGNTALVGASQDNHSDMFLHGSAYVFTRGGGVWTERQKLLGTHPTNTHVFRFGQSVALSGNGNAALVGADDRAFYFTRSTNTWTLTSQFQSPDSPENDNFGESVALNSDGATALIGAPFDTNSIGDIAGTAYLFARANGSWAQQHRFLPPDAAGAGAFGTSVALSSGGTTAVVGVPFGNRGISDSTGVAHIFVKAGSLWTRNQVQSPAPHNGDMFGEAVAVSADGAVALVGAKGPTPTFTGSSTTLTGEAHLFGVTVPPNPIDETAFFVRQHYHDFFSREPDAEGLAHWTNVIDSCGADAQCREVRRVNVSGAFFLSIEFQETGFLVERIYKAAYGDATGTSTLGGTHQLLVPVVRFEEFLPDTQRVGRGVVVNQGDWQGQLEANKTAFTQEFVQRPRFVSNFPLSMTPAQFVDRLNGRARGPLDAPERQALIDELAANNTTAGRASVLRKVAEDKTLEAAELNRAFVLMQYFGYLRRDPNEGPDADHTGYEFWLGNLNRFNGNFVEAELVKAFISSIEYRQRFGQ